MADFIWEREWALMDSDEEEEYLRTGWEPFAVTIEDIDVVGDPQHLIWFRRKVYIEITPLSEILFSAAYGEQEVKDG